MKLRYHIIYLLISVTFSLSNCTGIIRLQKNEYLLAKQDIVGNKEIKTADLEAYYIDSSNRKILGIPFWCYIYSLGEYYFNKKFIQQSYQHVLRSYTHQIAAAVHQPKKYQRLQEAQAKQVKYYENLLKNGNFLMQVGEPPRLYSPNKRKATEKNILQFLHTQGYFKAIVTSKIKLKHKKAHVRYIIQANEAFILREVTFNAPDTAIKNMLEPYAQTSLLQSGQPYNQDILENERNRIYALLINEGYWEFQKNYIWFNVDNTAQDNAVWIETVVALPPEGTPHQVYKLGEIDFTILGETARKDAQGNTLYEGITFKNIHPYFSPKVLLFKLPLKSGDIYSAQAVIALKQRLTALDIFKTIHVTHEPQGEQYLITHIQTSLLDKFQVGHEISADITKNSLIPFYQLALKIRNLFHQLDILTTGFQVSIELGAIAPNMRKMYNVANFEANINWQIPKIFLPLTMSQHTRMESYHPLTKINVGYKFTNHPNYRSYNLKEEITFITKLKHIALEIAPLNIRLINFTVKPDFAQELKEREKKGDISYKKYDPVLDTDITIKTTTRKQKSSLTQAGEHCSHWEVVLESGGTIQNFINIEKLLDFQFACYRYLKGQVDYTHYRQVREGSTIVFHYNTGILYPYNKLHLAPPDKYFSIGGSSSLRAWGDKSLGPGSAQPRSKKDNQYFNEGIGEVLIQLNAELRQQLIGVLEAAIFLDMGNIWILQNITRQGENFVWSRFYKELAVGTGVGLRLNFTFLVVLCDVGFKLYDPSYPMGERLFPNTMWEPILNIGLGYPF